ncbi:uncharacterized protein BDZ99DRAFT_523490 [Mytilinidion resinicola]|uniref:Glyoxalase/Bleomycin resistance protein/Dihydroxybiphenyl dioxygenase n=1 Tax=Mytilinidion resinicola TaxID=574789 RepID=A0A6A6YEI4_9PEZI|nr:uncharacterized protein BDZ99DRAFT_523490 [Mytilinidion resinicola]KAF2806933.1 hypothetical protein BDZ99DRAFT_523490 [Mytilinidion resinicola]
MILETFTRIFVNADALQNTVETYTSLLAGQQTMRFSYPETGLELAAVSSEHLSVLIIAGSAEHIAAFTETRLTIKVDRLEPYVDILANAGATQLDQIQKTPVGRKMRFRHADGMVVEYVDHEAKK